MKIAIDHVSVAAATVDLLSIASAPLAGVAPSVIAGVHATATHANTTKLAAHQLIGLTPTQATSAAIVVAYIVNVANATQMVGATASLASVAAAVIARVHATATHAKTAKLVACKAHTWVDQKIIAAIVVTHTGAGLERTIGPRVPTADASAVGATAPLAGVASHVITQVHATATHAKKTKLAARR
jgi:hypothetical protein